MAPNSSIPFPSGDAARDASLLDRYFAGECSLDEQAAVDAWFEANPRAREQQDAIRHGAKFPAMYVSPPSPPEMWAAFQTRIQASDKRQTDAVVPGRSVSKNDAAHVAANVGRSTRGSWDVPRFSGGSVTHSPWRRAFPYVLAVFVVGVLGLLLGRHMPWGQLSSRTDIAPTVYSTGRGERANITLPDGSTVVLSVASRLEVPTDYARGDRALRLTGEALFSVMHHPQDALTVVSGGITTRVLGTSFVVRHYSDDTTTVVAVHDGKVAVQAHVLSAGKELDVSARGVSQTHTVDPTLFTFASGVLTLENVPLRDAVVELSRWYDLDIRLGDPKLAEQRVGGGFVAGAQSDMMKFFEDAMELHVVREGREVTLYPRSN